ncbi:MAG: hypothetical protein N3A54_00660 [Patescibacteria group bacterium]|nr:hypothetical protein [Patescibacteria group bacterium]
MILSKETFEIFKILSQISQHLCVTKDSNFLRVMDETFSIAAEAYTKETFPETCAFDIAKFLGIYSLLSEREKDFNVNFQEKKIEIVTPTRNVTLTAIAPSMINYFTYINRNIVLPENPTFSFYLKKEVLKEIKKAMSYISQGSATDNVVSFSSDGISSVEVSVFDQKNPTSNVYKIVHEGDVTSSGSVKILFDLFSKLHNTDYLVSVFFMEKTAKVRCVSDGEEYKIVYYLSALMER